MATFRSIIGKWPSAEQFGADIGLKYRSYARVMKVRDSIPVSHWPKVLRAAKRRNILLTEDDLIAARDTKGGAA